jgi:hypothetical protein
MNIYTIWILMYLLRLFVQILLYIAIHYETIFEFLLYIKTALIISLRKKAYNLIIKKG